MENSIRLLTIATEPVLSSELFEYIYKRPFKNEVATNYPIEHLRSIHAGAFGGANGYLFSKEQVLEDVKRFINTQMNND